MTQRLSVTVKQAVEMTGISRSSFYRAFSSGQLSAVKHGRRVLIRMDDLSRFVEGFPSATFTKKEAA